MSSQRRLKQLFFSPYLISQSVLKCLLNILFLMTMKYLGSMAGCSPVMECPMHLGYCIF